MSRVGKQPVELPNGVKASVADGVVHVEGPKGKLDLKLAEGIQIITEPGKLIVQRGDDSRQARSNHGTMRARIESMVEGVTKGWKRSLELVGVGFNAKVQGQSVVLSVGFSHEVTIELPKEVKATVTKNTLELESVNREVLGIIAAKIRKVQPPEPYLGKGIKYTDETIRRKAGKTGKK